MKIRFIIIMLSLGMANLIQAQKLLTKNAEASFFSSAIMEDIEAHNKRAVAVLDLGSNEIAVKVLIKQFEFENSLMQEHFNENYMESSKFPSATFSGKINEEIRIDLAKDESFEVPISGEIEIHGVKQQIETTASLEVKGGKISGSTEFKVRIVDHDIKVPKLVIKNIAEIIDVKFIFVFNPKDNS